MRVKGVDDRFCGQVGSPAQKSYAAGLSAQVGFGALRYAVAEWAGCSVSKVANLNLDKGQASQLIDWLKAKKEGSR